MIGLAFLQAAAQQVAVTTSAPTDNAVATGGTAIVVATILQQLKNAQWMPGIGKDTPRLNFWVSVGAAVVTSIGIHWSYDAMKGGAIALPPLHVAWQGLVQWATQQLVYKGAVVPAETLGDIRTHLADLVAVWKDGEKKS